MTRKELEFEADKQITEQFEKGQKEQLGMKQGDVYDKVHSIPEKKLFHLYRYVQYKNNLMSPSDKKSIAHKIDEFKQIYEKYLNNFEKN